MKPLLNKLLINLLAKIFEMIVKFTAEKLIMIFNIKELNFLIIKPQYLIVENKLQK